MDFLAEWASFTNNNPALTRMAIFRFSPSDSFGNRNLAPVISSRRILPVVHRKFCPLCIAATSTICTQIYVSSYHLDSDTIGTGVSVIASDAIFEMTPKRHLCLLLSHFSNARLPFGNGPALDCNTGLRHLIRRISVSI